MKVWNRTVLVFALCLFCSLSADIIHIDDLKDAEQELLQLDQDALVLFDVDYTLLIPNDTILRPCGQELVKRLKSEIVEKDLDEYLHSQVLLQAKSSLVDEASPLLIRHLQERGIRTIALTAAPAGKWGVIESMADWRINELKEFHFDFSSAFPSVHFLEFPKKSDKEFHPVFKSGVLFSSKHPKGDVLKQFLDAMEWYPTKVLFIDDRIAYLLSVEKVVNEMGIDFTGFHYTAAEILPDKVDEKLAEFQFRYLAEHGEWLSDEEAKKMRDLFSSINISSMSYVNN